VTLSVLFTEAIGAKVDLDVKIRDGGTKHAAVFAIDGCLFPRPAQRISGGGCRLTLSNKRPERVVCRKPYPAR